MFSWNFDKQEVFDEKDYQNNCIDVRIFVMHVINLFERDIYSDIVNIVSFALNIRNIARSFKFDMQIYFFHIYAKI